MIKLYENLLTLGHSLTFYRKMQTDVKNPAYYTIESMSILFLHQTDRC